MALLTLSRSAFNAVWIVSSIKGGFSPVWASVPRIEGGGEYITAKLRRGIFSYEGLSRYAQLGQAE